MTYTTVPQDAMKVEANTFTNAMHNAVTAEGVGITSTNGGLTIYRNTELGVKYVTTYTALSAPASPPWSGGHIGPTLNVNGPGTYVVTVFVKDSQGNQICTIKDTSVVTSAPCTGIEEWQYGESVIISPNPNEGNFILEYNLKETATMEISDMGGKLTGRYNLNVSGGKTAITNDKLENGVYLYCVTTSDGRQIKAGRIIVLR